MTKINSVELENIWHYGLWIFFKVYWSLAGMVPIGSLHSNIWLGNFFEFVFLCTSQDLPEGWPTETGLSVLSVISLSWLYCLSCWSWWSFIRCLSCVPQVNSGVPQVSPLAHICTDFQANIRLKSCDGDPFIWLAAIGRAPSNICLGIFALKYLPWNICLRIFALKYLIEIMWWRPTYLVGSNWQGPLKYLPWKLLWIRLT